MRIRTALAATALAATALLGGASSAFAGEDHGGIAAAGGFHKEGKAGTYHSVGGDAGIVDATFAERDTAGWFAFLGG